MKRRGKISFILKLILSVVIFYFARKLFISGQAVWGLALSAILSVIPYLFKNSSHAYRFFVVAGLFYLSQICLWDDEKFIGTIVMIVLIVLAFELGVRIFPRKRPDSDNHPSE